jgi:hypothetical protein
VVAIRDPNPITMCLPDPPFSFAVSQESLKADDGAVPAHSKVTPNGGWKDLQRKIAKSEVKNKNSAPDEPALSGLTLFPGPNLKIPPASKPHIWHFIFIIKSPILFSDQLVRPLSPLLSLLFKFCLGS